MFPALYWLNFVELVKNELMKSISKKFNNISFPIKFVAPCCKDFKGL